LLLNLDPIKNEDWLKYSYSELNTKEILIFKILKYSQP
jgi:hypothetical protein